MSFTDEDLKRLKEAKEKLGNTGTGISFRWKELEALILRLEAAEALLQVYIRSEGYGEWVEPQYSTWQKAAGK